MVTFERALIVGVGGLFGSMARYLLGAWAARLLPPTFPFGTMLANVTGCLAIGALSVFADERFALGARARLFALVGVLGGFTTFSSFGYETFALIREGNHLLAGANVLGQVGAGLTAVWLGAVAVRIFV